MSIHRIFCIWLCWLASIAFAYADTPRPLAIVIAAASDIGVIKKIAPEELSLIYWRKKQYWQGGVRIYPVNLHAEDALRLQFSKTILGSFPNEQSNYWNGQYFHGISPPYSVQSEEAVIRYVAATKGAIGYVDACNVDERVKVLLWVNNEHILINKPAIDCP